MRNAGRAGMWAAVLAAAQLCFLAAAAADTCEEATASREEAKALIALCLEVSPATHPPCNPENDCSLVTDEIIRGCAFLGEDAPQACEAYAR